MVSLHTAVNPGESNIQRSLMFLVRHFWAQDVVVAYRVGWSNRVTGGTRRHQQSSQSNPLSSSVNSVELVKRHVVSILKFSNMVWSSKNYHPNPSRACLWVERTLPTSTSRGYRRQFTSNLHVLRSNSARGTPGRTTAYGDTAVFTTTLATVRRHHPRRPIGATEKVHKNKGTTRCPVPVENEWSRA